MLAKRLRHLREKSNYSQEDIANLLDVTPQQYYRWESGRNQPRNEIVTRLAKIFGVSTDYLIGRTDDPDRRETYDDLAPDEKALIDAVRTGRIWEIVRIIARIAPDVTEPIKDIIPPEGDEGR